MRVKHWIAAAVFMASAVAAAAPQDLPVVSVEVPQPQPAAGAIRLPALPTAGPVSGAVSRLTPDVILFVDSDVPVRVLTSPPGMVKVTAPEAGPLRVKGKFIDGGGRSETRTFTGKFIYFIEPVKSGAVELLVVPQGDAKPDDSDVQRRPLDVDAGDGPRPPPVDPKVDPNPPVGKVKPWGIVVIEENAVAVRDRGRFFADPELSGLIVKKGYMVRHVDKNVVDPITGKPPADIKRFLDFGAGNAKYPQFYVVGTDGGTLAAGDLSADPKELYKLLVKFGGE